LLIVVIGGTAYFLLSRKPAPPDASEVAAAVDSPEPVRPLGGDADVIDIPPLDESDPIVRELIRQLSSHPRVVAWLATKDLIRTFTASVVNIAEGKTPAAHLAVLRPSSAAAIVDRSGSLYLDTQSYQRYNTLADAVASVDPAGVARLYATLRPRIEEAHRDLGFPDVPFDRTLERAIVRLVDTPVVNGPVRVEPLDEGIGYGFADPRLEALTSAQKQLLRMGPRNALIIQGALREIAAALGIPSSRLPAASR
jgi:hypothetical protein